VFCSDVYVGGDDSSTGSQLTGLLAGKVDKPDPLFLWSGVGGAELGSLANVTSDVQQQIDARHLEFVYYLIRFTYLGYSLMSLLTPYDHGLQKIKC